MNPVIQPKYDTSQLWEQAELWPLRLTFLDIDGVTLWGTAGAADSRDRLLVESEQLVLADDPATLRRYIADDTHSVLAGLPGYEWLRERAQLDTVTLQPVLAFDYRAVAASLTRPPDAWTRDDCADLLDALNMLSDIADALADDELQREFDLAPFTTLQEHLTFLDEGESCTDALHEVDLDAINHLIGMAIGRAQRRSVILPTRHS